MNNRIERLAKELNALKSQVNNMNSPQLAFSSIEDGAINEYDENGNLVTIIGKQADGTHTINPVAGPVPPAPAGAEVQGGIGVLKVKWDGLFAGGEVAPMDFARVEVHISDTSGFTVEPLPNSTTRAGSIESAGGGEVALIRTAGTYYVKLITRAQTGKHSEPCPGEFPVVVEAVVSQEELDVVLAEVQAANADLANLQITLGEVETDLANAQSTLDTVDLIDGRLTNLETDVSGLDTDVTNATTAANNAVTTANAATSTANAAQAAADAAATAASNAAAEAGAATQAAQEAEAEALAAANLVADKSTVYWGLPEPAGDSHGLWINDGKPHLWDGTNWVVSEDPELTQAVADAAQAQTDAANALSTAQQAATDASNAVTAASQAASDAATAQTAAQTAQSAAQSAQTAAQAAATDSGNAVDASNAASAAAGAAQLAADNAELAAQDAEAAAAQAETDAANAVTVANNALTVGQDAQTKANAAVGTANSALSEAQTAADDAAAAIAEADAVEDRTLSRGTDLVTNGTAYLGDNTNFSLFTYDATDAPSGARGSFDHSGNYYNKWIDENIPVSTSKKYKFSYSIKQKNPNVTGSRHYAYALPVDDEGLQITPTSYLYRPGTTTTLAQPLNPGDTTVHLTSADNWIGRAGGPAAGGVGHYRTFIFWNYVDGNGKTWPAETYSRNGYYADMYNDGNIDPNTGVVTLNKPWPGKAFPAGTPVSNGGSGGTYMYAVTNALIDNEWQEFSGTYYPGVHDPVAGVPIGGNPIAATTKFPPGTAMIKVGWLLQYTTSTTPPAGETPVSSVGAVSFSDASAAQADANDANGTITLWKYPNTTFIDGGSIYTNSITANQIAAGAITADEIAANAVTTAKINAGAITAGTIASNAIISAKISANAVTAGKINADVITSREISAGAVKAAQIDAGAVVAGKIAAGAVTAGTIAANAVAAGTIAADAITGREINALAINTEHLVSGAIVADKIAAGAIIADKIAVNAITTEKIVALAIVGDKIAANAISADKILANAITSDKIVANAVITDKIAANAVVADKIAANAVTAEKIKAGEINVGHLAAGTLSADNITAGTINASIGIATTGAIIAGDFDGVAAELESTGLNVYILEDEAGNTTLPGTRRPYPMISLGSHDENALAITSGRTPEAMASLSADGAISGEHLSVGNDPQFNGQLLMGAWAYREADPTNMDRDSILWGMPWGITGDFVDVAAIAADRGYLSVPAPSLQMLAYHTWTLLAGRTYRVNLSNAQFSSTGGSKARVQLAMYTTATSGNDPRGLTPAVPSNTSGETIAVNRLLTPDTDGVSSRMAGDMTAVVRALRNVNQSFGVSIQPIVGDVTIQNDPYAWRFYVEDLGPTPGFVGGSGYPKVDTPEPPPPPPLQKYTYYFYPASVDLQQGSYNSNFTWSGVPQTDKAIQGWNVYTGTSNPAFHTNVRFGTSLSASGSSATGLKLAQVVAGAQTVEAKLRVTSAWSERSSVRAKIGWGQVDSSGPTTKVTSSPISPGGTTTVSLGTEGASYIKTYASGDDFRIYVGPGTQGSNVDLMGLYAMAGSSSQKMRLQVDVWK